MPEPKLCGIFKGKMDGLKYLLSALADLALPRVCIVCGRHLNVRENQLCIYCMADFPFTHFWRSPRNEMADRLNDMVCRDMDEGLRGYEPYSLACALFFYHTEAPYRKIPRELKYRKRTDTGRYFASLLAGRIFSCGMFDTVDTVVPVPLHWRRRLSRGYNQAEIIAVELARSGEKTTCRQSSQKENAYGLADKAVRLRTGSRMSAMHSRWTEGLPENFPRSIYLVVDDVFTTGATVNACHHALKDYFGPRIRISAATPVLRGRLLTPHIPVYFHEPVRQDFLVEIM